MNEKSTHNIVNAANYPLSLVVLLRDIWTRKTKKNALREKECSVGGIDKLFPIVSLYGLDRAVELCVNICNKMTKGRKNIRFSMQGNVHK